MGLICEALFGAFVATILIVGILAIVKVAGKEFKNIDDDKKQDEKH